MPTEHPGISVPDRGILASDIFTALTVLSVDRLATK